MSVKLKDMLDERQRHTIYHYHNDHVTLKPSDFKYWSTSKDGLWETHLCPRCGRAVTVPTGSR